MYQSIIGKTCIHQNSIRSEKPDFLYQSVSVRELCKKIDQQIPQQTTCHGKLILCEYRQQHGHRSKKNRSQKINHYVHTDHLTKSIRQHRQWLHQLHHFSHEVCVLIICTAFIGFAKSSFSTNIRIKYNIFIISSIIINYPCSLSS